MGLRHLKCSFSTIVKSYGLPIALDEFASSLAKVLTIPSISHRNGIQKRKIGLAISGGADSMALALLCSRLQRINVDHISNYSEEARDPLKIFEGISFQAFVVDHGVRENSQKEALSVSDILHARGISTQVLPIKWALPSPANSPSFESDARRHRFQTLGMACKKFGLDALLLAHHLDDQVETVFMRMASGHRVLGLTGIKGDAEIPECYGLHGVHESGGHLDNAVNALAAGSSRRTSQATGGSPQLPIERGGIRVYRPLLDFSKERLRATCTDAKMQWFEDHTNKDPTLTMRNAVRHMYSSHKMPPALSKPAILELSQRCRDKAAERLATMNTWLQKCSIFRLETRSGMLGVTFLDLNSVQGGLPSTFERQHLAASLLRRLIMLVTPEEHIDLASLHGAVNRIFPGLVQRDGKSECALKSTSSFTVAGVLFKPQLEHSPNSYLISRQNYPSNYSNQPSIDYSSEEWAQAEDWTPWNLWDGRFWIRLRKTHTRTISIRPLHKGDMKNFMKSLPKLDRTRLQDVLKDLAPGDVRWTLPAIVHMGTVLALPTLGFAIPGQGTGWEIRYKKVDLEGLNFAWEGA